MSSERSFDSESMARRFLGLASMGCAQDRRPAVQTVAVHPRRPLSVVAVAAALLLGGAACRHDGRTLAPTRPDQTTTTRAPSTLGTAPTVFTLSSDDVAEGGVLPARFTCAGEGVSPSLRWAATPAAVQLALVVRDRDAGGFVHWIVTGIDPTVTGVGESGVPEGATEQVNSTGAPGWFAPCPPAGAGRHVYEFVLHALAAPITIDPSLPAADVAAKIEAASTAQAKMSVSVTPGTAQPPGGSATSAP
jgi:Raf kinase inhibitor-like YbhB/YbcL family protein